MALVPGAGAAGGLAGALLAAGALALAALVAMAAAGAGEFTSSSLGIASSSLHKSWLWLTVQNGTTVCL